MKLIFLVSPLLNCRREYGERSKWRNAVHYHAHILVFFRITRLCLHLLYNSPWWITFSLYTLSLSTHFRKLVLIDFSLSSWWPFWITASRRGPEHNFHHFSQGSHSFLSLSIYTTFSLNERPIIHVCVPLMAAEKALYSLSLVIFFLWPFQAVGGWFECAEMRDKNQEKKYHRFNKKT